MYDYGGNCLIFVRTLETWNGARSYCFSKGAWLVEVFDAVKQEVLVAMANDANDVDEPNWWIGAFRETTSNLEWIWADGK